MNKIKRISYWFRLLFQLLFVALPIISIVFWINAPNPLGFPAAGFSINDIPKSITILHPLSNATKLYGFLINLIPLGCTELILFFLINLFRFFEQAEIFSVKNVQLIRNIGYTILLSQLLNPLYWALISVALTWHNPHGQRVMAITFDDTNIFRILTALLVILISWIIAEGYKLREEQQFTI